MLKTQSSQVTSPSKTIRRTSTVYGPVFSWRLGRSLGIDVLQPPKKCTFDCVYCHQGRTETYVPALEKMGESVANLEQVMADLDTTLGCLDMSTVDTVTFSGMGEPTLNSKLGEIASEVKKKVGSVPLTILTNSSLLYRDDVRKNISQFDVIVAKLDAGDEETFRSINRPADEALTIETVKGSIKKLKETVKGKLVLDVMLVHSKDVNVTNIKGKPFENLADAVLNLKPDLVHLEVPSRPPCESFVITPSQERIRIIYEYFSEKLGEEKVLAYGMHKRPDKSIKWLTHRSLQDECVELLKRKPCNLTDISLSLGIDPFTARKLVMRLQDRHLISEEIWYGSRYYRWIDRLIPQRRFSEILLELQGALEEDNQAVFGRASINLGREWANTINPPHSIEELMEKVADYFQNGLRIHESVKFEREGNDYVFKIKGCHACQAEVVKKKFGISPACILYMFPIGAVRTFFKIKSARLKESRKPGPPGDCELVYEIRLREA